MSIIKNQNWEYFEIISLNPTFTTRVVTDVIMRTSVDYTNVFQGFLPCLNHKDSPFNISYIYNCIENYKSFKNKIWHFDFKVLIFGVLQRIPRLWSNFSQNATVNYFQVKSSLHNYKEMLCQSYRKSRNRRWIVHCINDAEITHGILNHAKKLKDIRSNNKEDESFLEVREPLGGTVPLTLSHCIILTNSSLWHNIPAKVSFKLEKKKQNWLK